MIIFHRPREKINSKIMESVSVKRVCGSTNTYLPWLNSEFYFSTYPTIIALNAKFHPMMTRYIRKIRKKRARPIKTNRTRVSRITKLWNLYFQCLTNPFGSNNSQFCFLKCSDPAYRTSLPHQRNALYNFPVLKHLINVFFYQEGISEGSKSAYSSIHVPNLIKIMTNIGICPFLTHFTREFL